MCHQLELLPSQLLHLPRTISMTDISSKLFVWSKYMCMYLWMSYLGNNNYFPGNMHTWNQLQNSLLKLKQKFPDQEYYLYDAYTCMRKKNYNVKHKIGNISYTSWKIICMCTNLTSLAWASVTLLSGASVWLISVTCSAEQQKIIMLYFYMHDIKPLQLKITGKHCTCSPEVLFQFLLEMDSWAW